MSRNMGIPRRGLYGVPSSLSLMSLLSFVSTRCLWVTNIITEVFIWQHEGCKVNVWNASLTASVLLQPRLKDNGAVMQPGFWDETQPVESEHSLTQCTFVGGPLTKEPHISCWARQRTVKEHYALIDFRHWQDIGETVLRVEVMSICGFIEDESKCVRSKRPIAWIKDCPHTQISRYCEIWNEEFSFYSRFVQPK